MAREHRNSELTIGREGVSSAHLLPEDNPNVFSDDYAVDRLNDSGRSSPVSQLSDDDREPLPSVQPSTPRRSISHRMSQEESRLNARRSTTKPSHLRHHPQYSYPNRHQSTASRISYAQSTAHRTSSTSSRFSIPRSQSPYAGPTGPTQPYGMYPQATRASSVTSGSTVRPPERAFVGAGGPEHPYAMYSQNVGSEDETPDLPTVGFDGSREPFQRQRGPEGADFEDIIGPDGHAEQLPPYSRYADNVAPKVAAEYADTPPSGDPSTRQSVRENAPRVISMQRSFSHRSHFEVTDTDTPLRSPRTNVSSGEDGSGSFKEKVRATGRRRICCGLQLWVVAAMLAVLLLAGLVGGIIGAVVGNHHAQEQAMKATATAEPVETVTSTSWIDASPLPTGTNLPLIPIGQFNVPTDDRKIASNSCVADTNMARAWDCIPGGGIGITLKRDNSQNSHKNSKFPRTTVVLDSYPLSANFSYGPQLPDLMAREFSLMPSIDKEATSLGPALFFFALYDKLTILPEDKIIPPNQKRSISEKLFNKVVEKRDQGGSRYGQSRRKQMQAQPGEKPWFCYWNQTALEVFVYVTQNTTEASTGGGPPISSNPDLTPSPSASTAASSSTTSIPTGSSPQTPSTSTTPYTSPSPAISSIITNTEVNNNHPTYPPTYPPPAPPPDPSNWPPGPVRRDNHRGDNNEYPNYPLFVKVQEKRKPASEGNIQPYCQQMQILDDFRVTPLENIVQIDETEPANAQKDASDNESKRGVVFSGHLRGMGKMQLERRDPGMVDMGTNCCCEWLSV